MTREHATAKASASQVGRLGIKLKRQSLVDLLPRVVKVRREVDPACCDFTIH